MDESPVARDHGHLPGDGAILWGIAGRPGSGNEDQGENHVEVVGGGVEAGSAEAGTTAKLSGGVQAGLGPRHLGLDQQAR